jgi:hypothetical protein
MNEYIAALLLLASCGMTGACAAPTDEDEDDGAESTADALSAGVPTYDASTACKVDGRSRTLLEIVENEGEARWRVRGIGKDGSPEQKFSSGIGTFVDELDGYVFAHAKAHLSKEQHADGYWALMVAWQTRHDELEPRVIPASAFGSCASKVIDASRTAQFVLAVRAKSSAWRTPAYHYFADTRVAGAAKATRVRAGKDLWLLVDPPKADFARLPRPSSLDLQLPALTRSTPRSP